MEEQKSMEDWRDNVSEETATLKILDGEQVKVTFLDEGEQYVHQEYGKSIVFNVKKLAENEADGDYRFYVNPNNFALLKQLKELGELTGQTVTISRTGSKKSDTRYTVEKV